MGGFMQAPIALAMLAIVSGCTEGGSDDDNPETPWRTSLRSTDSAERARAVDAIPGDPTLTREEGLEALGSLIYDSDPRVREQAVLAYGQLADRDGIKLLKAVALAETDDNVGAAARASLDRIANAFPEPKRGWLNVEFPPELSANKQTSIRVRFGSTVDVPRARLVMQLPQGISLADSKREPTWRGSLKAGEIHDETFAIVPTTAELDTGTRLHLKLDYGPLDSERFNERVHVVLTKGRGYFEPLPPLTVTQP